MGWNSWDPHGTAAREEQVKANADWMAEHLAKYRRTTSGAKALAIN